METIAGRFAFRKTKENKIEFKGDGCYETRRESVESLIRDADKIISIPARNEWIWIWTNDRPESSPFHTDLFFATRDDTYTNHSLYVAKTKEILVPDFVFANWPQVGIHDFDTTCREIYKKGQVPALYEETCGWYGNVSLSKIRADLVNIAKRYPTTFKVVDTGHWKRPKLGESIRNQLQVSKNQYKSLPDLVSEYGMLIDVEGYGWSGRLKLLLHSNRPLLIQERPWNEYYFKALRPFVHYIPVKRDLSNLYEQVQWVIVNKKRAKEIAANASAFARFYLTRQAATHRWALQLASLPLPLHHVLEHDMNHPATEHVRLQMLYRLVSFLILFYSYAFILTSR